MNQRRTWCGSWLGSVQSKACGSNRPGGSRTNPHRIGTTGSPAWRQTAVPEHSSTTRSPPPYQPGTSPAPGRAATPARIAEHLGQVCQPLALGPRTSECSGQTGRCRIIEGGIKAQAGDADDPVADKSGQEIQGGEAAVGNQ